MKKWIIAGTVKNDTTPLLQKRVCVYATLQISSNGGFWDFLGPSDHTDLKMTAVIRLCLTGSWSMYVKITTTLFSHSPTHTYYFQCLTQSTSNSTTPPIRDSLDGTSTNRDPRCQTPTTHALTLSVSREKVFLKCKDCRIKTGKLV